MKMKQQRNAIGEGGGLTQRTKHLKSGKYTKQKGEINYKLISVCKRKTNYAKLPHLNKYVNKP